MVGDERPRRGSPGDGLHHGSFHFHVAALVQESAQRLDQPAALDEDLAHFGIDDQVDIALAIAEFHVGQAVPLLRQRQQILGEQGQFIDVHGQLARAGAEQIAAGADVIADIEQLEQLKALFADGIFFYVKLQPLSVLLQVQEAGLPHQAQRHDASGHPDLDAFGFQFLGRLRGVLRQDLRECCAWPRTDEDRDHGPGLESGPAFPDGGCRRYLRMPRRCEPVELNPRL